jgi:hypothetical protein
MIIRVQPVKADGWLGHSFGRRVAVLRAATIVKSNITAVCDIDGVSVDQASNVASTRRSRSTHCRRNISGIADTLP